MEESSGFKCCSMCMRHCFETHGDFGRSEAEELFCAPTFFSLIKSSHIKGSKFLRIPVLFLEKQNYNIGETLSLKGPWGFKCEVTVQRHSHGYVLHTGFNSFMKHHMIESGDALVFYLIAESSFLVKVYDKFGSEKIIPTKNSSTDAEPVLVSKTDSDGEQSDERGVDRMLNLRQKQFSKKREPSLQENCVDASPGSKDLASGGVGDMKQSVSRKQRPAQKRKSSAMQGVHYSEENESKPDNSSEFKRQEAAKRQVNAANSLVENLNNPSQLVVMAPTHIEKQSVYLSKLPLPNASTFLTLVDANGEQYNVKWSCASKGSRSRLSTGWKQLVEDHKLEVDDICVFEVSDSFVITIHIFRLAEYYMTNEDQQLEQDHRDDLQPSALEHSMSEELDSIGSKEEDTASAGFCS